MAEMTRSADMGRQSSPRWAPRFQRAPLYRRFRHPLLTAGLVQRTLKVPSLEIFDAVAVSGKVAQLSRTGRRSSPKCRSPVVRGTTCRCESREPLAGGTCSRTRSGKVTR